MAFWSGNPTPAWAGGVLAGLWASLWPERSAGMITPVSRAPGVTTNRPSTSGEIIGPAGHGLAPSSTLHETPGRRHERSSARPANRRNWHTDHPDLHVANHRCHTAGFAPDR